MCLFKPVWGDCTLVDNKYFPRVLLYISTGGQLPLKKDSLKRTPPDLMVLTWVKIRLKNQMTDRVVTLPNTETLLFLYNK